MFDDLTRGSASNVEMGVGLVTYDFPKGTWCVTLIFVKFR